MSFDLRANGYPDAVIDETIHGLVDDLVASGIADENPTLWGEAAEAEASIRLGWVQAVAVSRPLVAEIAQLRAQFLAEGLDRFVLAGMGGSSLAPEVITRTAGVELTILDSTAPSQVLDAIDGREADALRRTVLIVSSKSGSTVETDSARRAFEAAFTDLGIDPATRIVVVTDPESPLDIDARSAGYRVFNADPNVGGRFSALTAFGLVPSGLAGADIDELLNQAESILLDVAVDSTDNPALRLAAAIAGSLADGTPRKDKLGLIDESTSAIDLPVWIEQLVAESTGKEGTGVLPVVLLPVSPEVEDVPHDMQIVRLVDNVLDAALLNAPKHEVRVAGSLGEHFVVWEVATAVIGRMLGINPFDQPDVESAKSATRALLAAPPKATEPLFVESDVEVRTTHPTLAAEGTIAAALDALWELVPDDGYVAVHAYADRTELAQLSGLRELIAADSGRPTTFGWGPRFLHSTGQFHKGGPANGVFLQILAADTTDLEIPGRSFTFGQLLQAQAAGDAAVLAKHGRPVLTLTLTDPATDVLELFEATDN